MDWASAANCVGADPRVFFPAKSHHIPREAAALCASYPVASECLTYAIDRAWLTGIWSGTHVGTRIEIRRQLARSTRRPKGDYV